LIPGFFFRSRKIPPDVALKRLKGIGDTIMRTELRVCVCRSAVGGRVAQEWENRKMTTSTKLLISVLVGGSIPLFNVPVQAGIASSPLGIQGPVCKGIATSPLGVTSPVARGIATSPMGVNGTSPLGTQPPFEGGAGSGSRPFGTGPADGKTDYEPRTFQEYLEMMFEKGAW